MRPADLEKRWQQNIEWMDRSFEFYLENQLAQGKTREQAFERLKSIWERESDERLAAIARIGKAAKLADRKLGR
jgi:hypothetical protein